jgi:hypothetical protein
VEHLWSEAKNFGSQAKNAKKTTKKGGVTRQDEASLPGRHARPER